jgi:hypothetical protein
MELLTDGSIIGVSDNLHDWSRLYPGPDGKYEDGTWVQLPSSTYGASGLEAHVLKDGRLLYSGGEYIYYGGSNQARTEVYDPVANTWTVEASALVAIPDTSSVTMADGRLFYTEEQASDNTMIYDPTSNSWADSGAQAKPNNRTAGWGGGAEETAATLQNGGYFFCSGQTQAVYDPASKTWTSTTPSFNQTVWGDIGGIAQMYDGRVWTAGNNFSAIFTPGSTPTTVGSWLVGPTLSMGADFEDEYCVTEPNGKVMYTAANSTGNVSQAEYNPSTNTITEIGPAPDSSGGFSAWYLDLPTGQVASCTASGIYLYTPDGSPQDAWRPTVTSVTYNSGSTYTLSGTTLSGMVNGADEGDDGTMAENYPIVFLKNSSGQIWYCRTYSFSNMTAVKAGTAESCKFDTPSGLPSGTYSLYVSAVGVQSKNAYSFTTGSSSGGGGPIANGNHTLTPQNATGARLDAAGSGTTNGTKVEIWQANGGANQTWSFTNLSGSVYKIQPSYNTTLCLDVAGGATADGTKVDIWACSGATNQQWGANLVSGNVYTLAPQNATGERIDVNGAGTSNGTQVIIWHSNGGSNQNWAVN